MHRRRSGRRALFSRAAQLVPDRFQDRALFAWDETDLRKIRAHRIKSEDVEQGLSNSPIPIYEQGAQEEPRYVYYCETDAVRLLAAIVIERGEQVRVVTAYDLDAARKRDDLARRVRGE